MFWTAGHWTVVIGSNVVQWYCVYNYLHLTHMYGICNRFTQVWYNTYLLRIKILLYYHIILVHEY